LTLEQGLQALGRDPIAHGHIEIASLLEVGQRLS
jgi:hypothetical protein